MTKTPRVLLIESDPGSGDGHARQLEAAGHDVHRCYPQAGPGGREAGVACALRAGVPVFEDDLVAACEAAPHGGLAAVAREVVRRVDLVLRSAGVDPDSVACRVLSSGPDLRVVFSGPPIERSTRSALSVRALDAVHSSARRTLGQVNVQYVEHAA